MKIKNFKDFVNENLKPNQPENTNIESNVRYGEESECDVCDDDDYKVEFEEDDYYVDFGDSEEDYYDAQPKKQKSDFDDNYSSPDFDVEDYYGDDYEDINDFEYGKLEDDEPYISDTDVDTTSDEEDYI